MVQSKNTHRITPESIQSSLLTLPGRHAPSFPGFQRAEPFREFHQRVEWAALQHLSELVGELLPGCHREGDRYHAADLGGDRGRSLVMWIDKGNWKDFNADTCGSNLVTLYARVRGIDWRQAYDELAGRFGVARPERTSKRVVPAADAQRPNAPGPPPQAIPMNIYEIEKAAKEKKFREWAERIWRKESRPMAGRWAEAYLISRGLKPPWPDSLRAHLGLKHPTGAQLAALIAGVQDVNGKFSGIHRTYLDEPTKKTALDPPKASLGSIKGNAVRLSQEIRDTLVLCEGIEDGLSIAQTRGLIVWAALGINNLKAVKLPDWVVTLWIAADNDAPGRKAAEAAAKHFHEQGQMVRIAYPANGAKDFNEELMKTR